MSPKLNMLSLGLLSLLGLAGCATSNARHNETAQAVQSEMDAVARESVRQRENAKPVNLEAVNNALLPPLSIAMPKVDNKPLEARFDLTVNNTPAQQVFMAVVSGTRYNMLVPPGVTGNISLNLKDVTVFEALEAIREMYGYEYKVDANRIFIQPLSLQTRLFQVNYLTATRGGLSSLSVQSSSTAGTTAGTTGATGVTGTTATTGTTSTTGTTALGTTTGSTASLARNTSSSVMTTSNPKSNFWTELEASLKAIVGNENGRSVVINSMSGVIVVRAMPDELKSVTAYLKASQISIERQVILEAKIVEVQLNDSYQSGVNWAGFMNDSANRRGSAGVVSPDGALVPTGPGGVAQALAGAALSALPGGSLAAAGTAPGAMFGLALQTSNFAALLNYLESQGSVHVLSSPRIATLNNQKAILKVGTDEYFITGFSTTSTVTTTTATTQGTVTPNYTSMFSGIALDVTPNINERNEIILHVHPSVTSISEKNKFALFGPSGTTNGTIPMASTSVSETDSVVRARDGQIVVIGGLMRQATFDDHSGLPGSSHPMFGQASKHTEKRELVLLLKPTVVDSDGSWSDDIVRSRDRMSSMTNH